MPRKKKEDIANNEVEVKEPVKRTRRAKKDELTDAVNDEKINAPSEGTFSSPEFEEEYKRRKELYDDVVDRAKFYGKPIFLVLQFTGKMEKMEISIDYDQAKELDYLQQVVVDNYSKGKLYDGWVQIRSGKNNHWNIKHFKRYLVFSYFSAQSCSLHSSPS